MYCLLTMFIHNMLTLIAECLMVTRIAINYEVHESPLFYLACNGADIGGTVK
jgi:hypothetical protein